MSRYELATRVDRNNLDAAVGIAEAHLAMGRLRQQMGDAAGAREHFVLSARKYGSIAGDPKLWKDFGSTTERSEFLFNWACACALAGSLQEACLALSQCCSFGIVTPAEIQADADLVAIRSQFNPPA